MLTDRQLIYELTTSSLRKFKGEELVYFAITALSLIGVAITDYAPQHSWVYWFFMIAAFATASIVLEKLQIPRKEVPFSTILITQLLHWLATFIAVLISFSFITTGRLTYEGMGLVILLILSLSVFLNGIHVGWRFYLAGSLLALTTVMAAYFEEFIWIIVFAAITGVVFAVYLEKFLVARKQNNQAT